MAKRGRPPRTDPPCSITISIPTSILTKVDKQLEDPLLGHPALGERSALITRLLKEWLDGGRLDD